MKKAIEKRDAREIWDAMNECHITGKHRMAVIVFKQSNFKDEYSVESRSYRSYSDQWGWDYDKMGNCRLGDCLDGTETGVRLDWYNWDIEYWYWEN